MLKKNNILSEVPLFGGLPPAEMEKLASVSVPLEVEKGTLIFSEGDIADGFYVVVKGMVKIRKVSADGKEKILHMFGPPEPFGEVPVFAGTRFPAGAEAVTKSRLLFFPRDAFVRLVSENPSLSLNMLAVLSGRLRQFAAQIEALSLKEIPSRLASYLLALSLENSSGEEVLLSVSKGQLAGLLGTVPETLSRIFSRMTQREMIRVEGRRIHILDWEGLQDLSDGGKLAE